MSEMLKEMSESLLRNPDGVASSEAAHVALLLANAAWNETVGLVGNRDSYRGVLNTIEAENPELWNEFKTTDIKALLDELKQYKQAHYPDDRRRVLLCGIVNGKVRVEWMNAAAPGVDAEWETHLYSLVRTGERKEAIRFFQETRRMPRNLASRRVREIAAEFGLVLGFGLPDNFRG